MRIAIYGRKFNDSAIQHVQQLIDSFLAHEVEITIYAAFHAYLIPRIQLPASVKLFTQHQDLINQDPVGELYVVGTHPDHAGRGIARALSVEAINYLVSKGLKHAILYVDADNEKGLKLYGSLGFN